jgi:hypothetical protein
MPPKAPPSRNAKPSNQAAKRKALTLRLHPDDWVELVTLAAKLSVKRGRQITAHAIIHAATMRALEEKAEGLELEGGDED